MLLEQLGLNAPPVFESRADEGLEKRMRLQGLRLAIGAITLPNPASIGLHEALGFRLAGTHRACGYKLGRWHAVGFWELTLAPEEDGDPALPRPPAALAASAAWDAAMRTGLSD